MRSQRALREIAKNTTPRLVTIIDERPKLKVFLLPNAGEIELRVPAGVKWELLAYDVVYSISPAGDNTFYMNASRSDDFVSWDAFYSITDTLTAASSGEISRMKGIDLPEAWLHHHDRIYFHSAGFVPGGDTIQIAVWYKEVYLV